VFSPFQQIYSASLLRKVWLQCFGLFLLILAAFQIIAGVKEFGSYSSKVSTCVSEHLMSINDTLARNVKLGYLEVVTAQLNSIEYACVYEDQLSLGGQGSNDTILYSASFFWVVEREGKQELRIGKNLLQGPIDKIVYPLSVWNRGESGDYWIGSVSVELFYGDFVNHIAQMSWKEFASHVVLMLLLSLVGFFVIFIQIIRPNLEFAKAFSGSQPDSLSLRRLIKGRRDELSFLWKEFLNLKEEQEIERFEFEAQVRDLESHISKIERGHAGQSQTIEQATLHIKNALFSAMSAQAIGVRRGDRQAEFASDYLSAITSVAANLHERSLMESGEIGLNIIVFNIRVLLAQIHSEFRERVECRGIEFSYELDSNLPDYVSGDPEKIKRILRNGFKRCLLEYKVDRLSFRATYKKDTRNGPRVIMDLVVTPKSSGSDVLVDDNQASHLFEPSERAQAPTPVLEMLCYLMGAHWIFSKTPDGGLKQSLSIALPEASVPPAESIQLTDYRYLNHVKAAVYDFYEKAESGLAKTLEQHVHSVRYYNSAERMLQSFSEKANSVDLDIVVISDIVPTMHIREFLSALRRLIPSSVQLFIVSERPQLGDAQYYSDLGAQAFMARKHFALTGLKAVNFLCQFVALYGRIPQLLTRYTLLDYVGAKGNSLALPKDVYPDANGKVLLVAEELVCIEFVRIHCKRAGYEMLHFDSLFDALDSYRFERYDAVFVDESFSEADVLTVIDMLRESGENNAGNKPCPIVAMASVSDDESIELYSKVGATKILHKPFVDDSFTQAFDQILGLGG